MSRIPVKNYIYLLLVVLLTVGIVYYLYLWFVEYDTNQENTSVLVGNLQVINVNDLDNYLIENKNAIIYVSVSNDIKVRQFDKKLLKLIKQKNLNNKILYLDLKNEKRNILNGHEINVASLIIYNNGNLIDIYDIKNDNYNIFKLEDYLVRYGVVNYD